MLFMSTSLGLENDGMGHFEISPDGRFIVFLGKYGNMHLISAKVWYNIYLSIYLSRP